MTRFPNDNQRRIDELLLDRAAGMLDDAGRAELDALLRESGAPDDRPTAQDLAAAAIVLGAPVDDAPPMPESLRRALIAGATRPSSDASGGASRAGRIRAREAFAWLLAAAGLALAVTAWWPTITGASSSRAPAATVVRSLSDLSQDELRARRDALLAQAPDVVSMPWQTLADPAAQGVSGTLVWSTSRQEGYMTFRGLATNDPDQQQYQLWIFDADLPDERYPIDGGLFNVSVREASSRAAPPAADEWIVPIDPRIRVRTPQAFAVTIERPGGVVVTTRERLLLLAPVEPAQPADNES